MTTASKAFESLAKLHEYGIIAGAAMTEALKSAAKFFEGKPAGDGQTSTPIEALLLGQTIVEIEQIGEQSMSLRFSDGSIVLVRAQHNRPSRMTWLAVVPVDLEPEEVI